jgi:hypothetical protein
VIRTGVSRIAGCYYQPFELCVSERQCCNLEETV